MTHTECNMGVLMAETMKILSYWMWCHIVW